jgi:putative N6-adenine-specific DNA methylase
MLTGRLAPGKNRRFAFMDWPNFDAGLWQSLVNLAVSAEQPVPPNIQASDRDAGAIQIAQANAGRAGVVEKIKFIQQAFSAIEPPQGGGWIVTNPPYGVRVSPAHDLRNLYSQLGKVLHSLCPGWKVGILCNSDFLVGHTGLHFEQSIPLVNGGIPVKFYLGRIT